MERRILGWSRSRSGSRTAGSARQGLPAANGHFCPQGFFFFSHLDKVSLQVSSHAGFEHPQQPAGMLRWVWGSSGCARSGCVLGASPAVQRWSTAVDPVCFGNSWAFGFLTGIWFMCVVTDRGGQGRGGPALCLGHSFGLGPSSLGNNSVFLTK